MKTQHRQKIPSLVATLLLGVSTGLQAQNGAVPLPDPKIPGFHLPEAEATIMSWVYDWTTNGSKPGRSHAEASKVAKEAFAKIHLHGWGIWTALTTETKQSFDGQKLRVFETWPTPQDIRDAGDKPHGLKALLALPPSRSAPQSFHQFDHVKGTRGGVLKRGAGASFHGEETVTGFVKYDPSAALHVSEQGLFKKATLDALLNVGANQVPAFPSTALVLKPVFQTLTGLVGGRYYPLPVWAGPPAEPQSWPSEKWGNWVWIDIQNGGQGKGETDKTGSKDGSSRTEATTYPVSSFIHYKLDSAQASALNANNAEQAKENGSTAPASAKAGDYTVLTAMHVAGRETTRWTWQTFWWAPQADQPPLPSSKEIADLRPAQLQDAARHYAMALAYSNLAPTDPYVGGANVGESLYAYNPYLEAGFGPSDLPDSIPGYDTNGKVVANNVGVQTNCMSCHGAANYTNGSLITAPAYSGDRYISLDDPRFRGTLQVDFLWSIPGNAR
jgi:hypothetical protein